MYDITLTGSLIGEGNTLEQAKSAARYISEYTHPGRLIRVHHLDGETVLAEYRDGKELAVSGV